MKKYIATLHLPAWENSHYFVMLPLVSPGNVKQVVALQNTGRFLRLPIPVPPIVYVIIMAEYIFLSQFFLNRSIVQSIEFELVGS